MTSTAITSKSASTALTSDRMRTASLWSGAMYLLTFVSIPSLAFYGSVKDADYLSGSSGSDAGVLVGGALELIVGLACIGTAVALYPVVSRQGETRAIGFVAARTLEAGLIFVGVASLWTIMSLRQDGATDAALVGQALAAFYDKVFLVSQGAIPALNALLLGSLLFQSRLVPRVLPVLGFFGAGTRLAYNAASLLGFSGGLAELLALVAVLPIATWEFALGVYLVVKGFRPAAVARLDTVPARLGSPWPGLHVQADPQGSGRALPA